MTPDDFERKLDHLIDLIGTGSDDGSGGTGLIGRINRLSTTVDELTALKNKGVGAVLAVGLFGILIVLGIRQWITGLFPHP